MNKIIVKARAILAAKKAEMYVSKVVWTLAVIIVGMLLMWGVYGIFNLTVLPGVQQWFNDLFATGDGLIDASNAGQQFTSGGYADSTPGGEG